MSFKIIGSKDKKMPATAVADRRLYLTSDKSRVVEERDSSAAWLFAVPGDGISEADRAAYGLELIDGRIVLPGARASQRPPKAAAPVEPKAMKFHEDKAAEKAEDKAAKKAEDKAAGAKWKSRE